MRREGRLTTGQQRALDAALPRLGLDGREGTIDLDTEFGRRAPRTLEIGFGDGESLAELARRHPDRDFIGIEVHRPGVGHLLNIAEREGLSNLRVFTRDAVEVLESAIADGALDAVLLFFPDPWHKKRHHKRRIVRPEFVALIHRKLRAGGQFHLATDWEDYAEHMLATVSAHPGFANLSGEGSFAPRPEQRPITKFERRGQRLGHGVWDLLFERRAN